MSSGGGQEGSTQRASASGSAVPHRNGHRHSLPHTTHSSTSDRPDPERIRPSFAPLFQTTLSNVAPPRTATGRAKAVARKTTGKVLPRTSQPQPRPTPKKYERVIQDSDSDSSVPLPLDEIRRQSGQWHQNTKPAQKSASRHSRTTTTTSSSSRSGPFASTSTQRTGPIRPKIRPTTKDQRAKAKRQSILPLPTRNQPPPPGAEVLEISSDDEEGIIDLTRDDSDNEGVSPVLLSPLAAANAPESSAPAINSPSAAPSFFSAALNAGQLPSRLKAVTQATAPPLAFASPNLRSTQIPVRGGPSATFEGLVPAHAPDVPPSNVFAASPSSTAPVISPIAISDSIPRQNAPPRLSSATRSSLPPMFLTNRRTPVSPSTHAAGLPPHGLSPAPVQSRSLLAAAVGWDQAVKESLDTPIEEEDHRLDVDMGGDGYMDNVHTSGSTTLQAPTTDDEPPPPSTPNGEDMDMELDVGVLKEGNASVSVVPVQGPVPVPDPVTNVVTPLAVPFLASPSRPLASAPPEKIRPALSGVTPPFAAVRSQTAPILSSTVAPAPALGPASTGGADESDVVEGTDVTMDTSCSGDGQVSPEFHAGLLPRRTYSGFESSEDELTGGVISEYSSISALATDNEEIVTAATTEPSDPTDGLTDFAKEIYADILEKNSSDAAYYARMSRKYPGEKLDTRIADMMNALPEPWKQDVTTRLTFESYMMSSVAAYNPWSPPIKVINNIDAQPNPPWEFVYTERMVYGNGVKKPTKAEMGARGCDCYPYCKPDDRNCACLRRQEKYGRGVDLKGFRYTSDGLLTFTDPVPIFECTDGCHCNEDCPNRVAQYGRTKKLALEKTMNKGWGVVAMEPIPAGSFLGVYSGELLLPCEVDVREAFYNTYGRTYTFEIDFHYLKQRGKKRGRKTSAKYAIDAFHAGCFTRYLNHSCAPNCVIIPVIYGEATADTPYLGFYTRSHVREGEGLEFSYKGVPDEEQFINLARAARFRKKKERAIAAGQKFDTGSALCQCGARNCDGSMWQWEHEKNEDEGENSDNGMEVIEGEREIRPIGVLDDPDDGEYEDTDEEVDELESSDEDPRPIEMV